MTRGTNTRYRRKIQALATVLCGLMVLSVVVGPAVATSTHDTELDASASAVDASTAASASLPHEGGSGNHSLSIPGRSFAQATDPGSSSTDISGNFAMEFWIRYNASSDANAVVMTKGGIPGNDNGNYMVTLDGTGDARTITFAFNNFAGSLTSSSEIPARQWTHVAFTYDGSTQTIYINGEKDAQRSEGSAPATTDDAFNIGVDDSESGHFLDGRVDDVRLWGQSRNVIEIEDNMLTELSGSESGLQAHYQFDQGGKTDGAGSADLSFTGSAKLVTPDANLGNSPPPFLHATPTNDSVILNWTARSAGPNTAGTVNYKIYRSTKPAFSSSKLWVTVRGNLTGYEDVLVTNGTTYYYWIRAQDSSAELAGYSKAAVARPYVERGGGSLKVDGRGWGEVSDRPSAELGSRGDFAVEFWLKYDASSDEDAVVVTKGGIPGQTSGSYTAYLEGTGEGRQIVFSFNNFAGSITSNTEIQAGQWTHVAFTYDGSTQTLYLNGQQDAQRSEGSVPSANGAPIHVGTDDSEGGHFLDGRVEDLRLWETTRQRSEIVANYRNRLIGDESGLLNYWRFNEIGADYPVRSSQTRKSNMTLNGDAQIAKGGAYPVAPYVFATSENAAANVTYKNRMGQPLDAIYYDHTTSSPGVPSRPAGKFQPDQFNPRQVTGLSNNVTYYHYIQSVVDGQRSDFPRAATSTPYNDSGGSALSVGDGSYGTADHRPSLNVGSEFTLSFWVKYKPSSDERAVVLTKGGTPGTSSGNYRVTLEGTGEDRRVQFAFNNFAGSLTSDSGIPANVWTHVAFTQDAGGTQSLYINGKLDAQRSESSDPSGVSAPLRIGTDDPATGHYLDGQVDEVQIWNDSRTDQEIANTYVNGFVGNESGLEHYWRFDDAPENASRGSAAWHATVETRDGASLAEPGVLPVPPRTYARGENGQAEVVWRVRNRPDEVSLYRSDTRSRSARTEVSTGDADRRSVFVDAGLANNDTKFYEATSTDGDGQESDYSFPASALPSALTAGNAWSFNGKSSYVTVEDRPALDINTKDYSLSFWVKYNETSDADAVILSKGGTPGSGSGNYMATLVGTGPSRKVEFSFNNFAGSLTSTSAIQAGEWTHVAFTQKSGTQTIYINGTLDAQRTGEGSQPSGVSSPLRIGSDNPATGHYLQGQVDEVRIAEPGRTKAEIKSTYNRELVGDEAGLEGYWRGCYAPTKGDSVWGHARKPMTASFTDMSCAPSTIGADDGDVTFEDQSLTSTFNVTLDGNTNGLNSYFIELNTGADTVIRTIEPGIINGTRFDVVEGGPGERNVTASASEETGIVGTSSETRTLFQVTYRGNVTRDDLQLSVIELSNDNFNPIAASAVSVTKVGSTGGDGTGDGGDGTTSGATDVRSAPAEINPGGTKTVTLEANASASSLTFQESFSPAFDSVSIKSVTVNGNSVQPFLSTAESTGVVVTVDGLSQGDTVKVKYTVSVASSVSAGTTYNIGGNVTSGTTTVLATNQTTVQQGSPLSGAPGRYDKDFNGEINIQELGAAAADYARGDINIQELGAVAAAYAQS